jgi:hypothetical protein
MAEDRGAPTTLKGRLADVYVPAMVEGAREALSRRLGNRATIDDPLFGRATNLATIEPFLAKACTFFAEAKATYRHVASTSGVGRDVSEGLVQMMASGEVGDVPILVVAERRRMREIELRLYYSALGDLDRKARAPLVESAENLAMPQVVAHVLDALRKGAVERVLAAFEETSRIVDPRGADFRKRDGRMASFITDLGSLDLVPGGTADDGRTCCVETTLTRWGHDATPAALSFVRGDSGLLRELRIYWDA